MPPTANKLKERYNRLKKAMEKMLNPKKEEALSQLVLQPVRHQPDNYRRS